MESITRITLNLQAPNVATVAHAVQNDRLARQISAQLVDGSTAWTPPYGAAAMIRYVKPDGTGGFYDTDEDGNPATVIDGSTVLMTLAEQVLTVPGDVYMQLQFYGSGGERLTSLAWLLRVQKNVLSDAEIISSDYYNVLTEQIAAVLNAAASLTGMTASASGLPTGATPTVNVTGGSDGEPYNLAFGIPAGATGPQGPKGDPGAGSPGTALPLMDGVASAGSSDLFAPEDHRHPFDTSRAAADEHVLKSYSTVSQVTDIVSPTIEQIWDALPTNSILVAPASDFQSSELPAQEGTLELCKGSAAAAGWITFHGLSGGADYTQAIASGSPSGTWDLVVKSSDFSVIIKTARSSTTIAAGASSIITIDIFEQGKRPIAIVGVRAGTAGLVLTQFYFLSNLNSANIEFRNVTSGSVTVTPDVRIMYVPE